MKEGTEKEKEGFRQKRVESRKKEYKEENSNRKMTE